MGHLSTHVLDTAQGRPAGGMAVTLSKGDGTVIQRVVLNADGRNEGPLLQGDELAPGGYRLSFEVAAYFRTQGVSLPEPPFLDIVHLDFGVADASAKYHVPLLVSPWSYSTYRELMEVGYLLDWANLLLRWAHVITAIAWIGSSFYFVFLDNSLTAPLDPELKAKGVNGELWAVHGGGFYHPQKYLVAPKSLPEKLHWFFWESYSTWLTGFALFAVLYLFNAESFLIDARVFAWGSSGAAIAASLGFVFGFWFIYDAICRIAGVARDALVGALVALVVVAASWAACQLFAGRAAFLIVGAMMATAMSANVLVWIIPGQRKVIAQMKAGEPVDPIHGQRGKQRSVHNTYFTLPVLIAMLSNHYGFLYSGAQPWAVLLLLMLAGALIRHVFVVRHKALVEGRRVPWEYALVGTALLVGLAVWLAPAPRAMAPAAAPKVSTEQIAAIATQRCAICHGEGVAQKGVALHTVALLDQQAQQVYQQVVVTKQMPLNNVTGLTEEERALIARWFEQRR